MPPKKSARSSTKPASGYFEVDADSPDLPCQTKLCGSWERIQQAIATKPILDQYAAWIELERRVQEKISELKHNLSTKKK